MICQKYCSLIILSAGIPSCVPNLEPVAALIQVMKDANNNDLWKTFIILPLTAIPVFSFVIDLK